MKFFAASSTIAASADEVWAVLSDSAGWPTWDSGVEGVEGAVAPDAKVKIRSEAAPGRAFAVKVTAFRPGQQLQLTGGMPLGLFRGVRTYDLSPNPAGGTDFRLREEYTGPMLGMIWKSMPDLGPSFEKFASGLKRRVESGA